MISDDCFTFHSVVIMRGWIAVYYNDLDESSLYLNVILNHKMVLIFKSASNRSDGFVWVEHDSEVGSSSATSEVLGELDSNHTGVSVGGHDGTPLDSISGVV